MEVLDGNPRPSVYQSWVFMSGPLSKKSLARFTEALLEGNLLWVAIPIPKDVDLRSLRADAK